MKTIHSILLLFCGLLFFAACGSETAPPKSETTSQKETAKPTQTKPAAATSPKGKIEWVSLEDVEKLSKKEKRKVMVDLYTSWCGWCKRMDKDTFADGTIADYVNTHFYAVKFDAENKNEIRFKGEGHNFKAAGRRGYNELAFKFANGRMSYPTISFLDENLNNINAFPGYKPADKFESLLYFVEENHYQSTTYDKFAANFESKR